MTACSVNEIEPIIETNTPEENPLELLQEYTIEFTATSAELDAQTKSVLIQDGELANGQPQMKTWWSPEEEICIYYGASERNKFTSTNTELAQKATFTGTLNAFTGENESGDFNYFWAVYPYDAAVSCDGESLVAILADEQEACAGSYANKTNVTIAKSPGLSLAFYNVCSFLRFTVEKAGVIAVTFRGNNNEDVAGKFRVSIGGDGRPTVPEIIDGEKEITLTRPNNEAFEVGESYYFVLLPQTFEKGFTVQFETANQVGYRVINVSAPFTRNNINYGNTAFDQGVTYASNRIPPENEIWYTTSDESLLDIKGNLIWYRSLSGFEDNHIVYHKYKRGKGIIRFDGPVKHIPQNAFKDCVKMTRVMLPNNVETFQSSAFEGTSIISFDFPTSLKSIGSFAFKDVKTMSYVQINGTVEEVGTAAFMNNSITSARVYGKKLDNYIFKDSNLNSLYIGSPCTSIGKGIVSGCTNLESIEVAWDNSVYTSSYKSNSQSSPMNCIMRISDRTILAGCKATRFYTLSHYNGYSVYADAFCKVGLSNNVSFIASGSISIGTSAFWGNDIRNIYIGSDYTDVTIDSNAFGSNPNLSSVHFSSKRTPTIGTDIFLNCGNGFTIYVPAISLNNYKTTTNLSKYASIMVGE